MSKVPTRSPTHREVDLGRLAALGLEVDELAEDGVVTLAAVTELAEDRGRPVSHYLAGLALATETTLAVTPGLPVLTVCAGKCQSWARARPARPRRRDGTAPRRLRPARGELPRPVRPGPGRDLGQRRRHRGAGAGDAGAARRGHRQRRALSEAGRYVNRWNEPDRASSVGR